MPGLVRGVARTAVIAGTASAVSGRVQRRQAERYADRDAQIAAERQQSYLQQTGYAQSAPPPQAGGGGDVVQQLKDLAELKNQGILTEAEFAAQKAKILGS